MKVSIIVHTNSKNPRIEQRAGILHAYVPQPPVEGKANAAIIAQMAKFFNVSKSRVRLLRGQKSKTKTFEII